MSENGQVCVLYCRVSSDRQAEADKGSLDDQEARCRAKATALGLSVLRVQRDAESAWVLDKRSQFQRVLVDARAGKFDVLVVDRMNRFTRGEDMSDYMQVMVALRQAGVEVVFAEKDYGSGAASQLMQYLDAYVSAGEQANRRKQIMGGKRTRVYRHRHVLPGSRPTYGYQWVDAAKTQATFAVEGDGAPTESQRVVRRIWSHFLYGEAPTLAGMAKTLNREGIRSPREYAGVKAPVGTAPIGPRWTAETIRFILHNEIYWRGDENDMVKAYAGSKYEEPTLIPAYAPAYVSKAEAARVHARLLTNQRYASRNRKREWATLLHGGLVRCAQCGWALTPTEHPRVRKDGSRLTMYRCQQSILYGKRTCAGVTISAETLDAAVEALLTAELSNGEFLARFFAAWEADATLAMGSVREIETTIKETKGQIDNQVRRLATLAPGDALAAPVEANVRMLSETLAPLEERRDRAVAAAEKARGNDALREELSEWFSAWMFGFASLSLGRKREFLFSVGAKVLLHREGERDPRAQLLIALPTSASALPPAPWADGADGWELDLDLEEGATLAAIQREYHDFVTPARGMTAEEEVAWYEERLIEAGFDTAAAKLRAMSIARSPFRRC